MAQAMEYENWDDPSDRVRRFFNEIGRTHPYAVRRVSEVMKWVQSGEYDRIIRGEYRTRDQPTDVRGEAGDAMEFYAERFRTIFREAGDNIATIGSQVGGMAEQVADWIRKRGGPGAQAGRVARVARRLGWLRRLGCASGGSGESSESGGSGSPGGSGDGGPEDNGE